MTLTDRELADHLVRIAKADYREPDPTTGRYYETDGELIVYAAARLREYEALFRRIKRIVKT